MEVGVRRMSRAGEWNARHQREEGLAANAWQPRGVLVEKSSMVSTVRQDSDARSRSRERIREADIAAFVAGTRARQQYARYPGLLSEGDRERRPLPESPWFRREAWTGGPAPIVRIERTREGASGLIVVALRHGDLTERQWRDLSAFRLEQCVLCGWYDPAVVLDNGDFLDPASETLADDAIHLVVGTREGLILSYFCFEPASAQSGEYRHAPTARDGRTGASNGADADGDGRAPAPVWTIADHGRPVFATERDLFGPGVFAALPGLASAPISRVREVNYLMRNQVVPLTSRLGSLAVVEAVSAVGQLLFASSPPLVALVGNMDLEARRLLHDLDIPVLYAPHMPGIAGDSQCPWSAEVDAPGRFWPFVIAADDLQITYREYPIWLDMVLGLPVSQAVLMLMTKRRGPKVQPPLQFASAAGTRSTLESNAGDLPMGEGLWVPWIEFADEAGEDDQRSDKRVTRLVAPRASTQSS